MFDATITKEECVLWIREFFEKNGPDCNAVIGISGGKDSIRHYTINIRDSVEGLKKTFPSNCPVKENQPSCKNPYGSALCGLAK